MCIHKKIISVCAPQGSCCLWTQVSNWGQTGCSLLYFRSEHRSTSPTVYVILLSDIMPSRSFWSVCVHRKFLFFSVNTGEIFIMVAGLWYSFPIYLPEMRSQLKEKHKKGLICESVWTRHMFFLPFFFNIW